MAATLERVPPHLRRFVVEQDYAAYTAVDHAVWRFVLLQMYDRLRRTAHPAYARGLTQTGMSVERIPKIADMDCCLSALGWGAVCVDGFIPPRAFVELQALGILPIAAEIRRVEHLPYTPAPDIIHEAGGHAPILPDVEYAAYLRKIGAYGVRAFASVRDAQLYEAIRALSIVKERRDADASEIAAAERALAELVAQTEAPSEAAQLARLYWWTAEYGLVGTPRDYKLYGAGLLSSLAESHFCHAPEVRKLALTRECVAVDYDITRPQPQLFVARELGELSEVLEAVCAGFAFRSGGLAGLRTALAAREVATVELDSGLAITGEVDEVVAGADVGAGAFVRMRGGCAIGEAGKILAGEGRGRHPDGLAVVLGASANPDAAAGQQVELACAGGMRVAGRAARAVGAGRRLGVVLEDAEITHGAVLLWRAERGRALLLAPCTGVSSVRAGADDAGYWPDAEYAGTRAPARAPEDARQRTLRGLYERSAARAPSDLVRVHEQLQREQPDEWLLRWNLLDALTELDVEPERRARLAAELWQLEERYAGRNPIAMGLRYLGHDG